MSRAVSQQTDLFPGAVSGVSPVGAAVVDDRLRQTAARLPRTVRLGTSSWSFPGWSGIVYDRPASKEALARDGLAAYAAHPLFACVGVDRGFYRPLDRGLMRSWARAVPAGFRFLVKAPRECVSPTLGPPGGRASRNEAFLDPAFAHDAFVGPVLEELGPLAGPLLFQFPPMEHRLARRSGAFADRLFTFLSALPRSGLYAVELRNTELLVPAYADALRGAGAIHCLNVHPSMPPLPEQRGTVGTDLCEPLVVRWMLGHGQAYEAARDRYAPFDRLVDEDPENRDAIARACLEATGRGAFVIVNNKAEGSSPLSVGRLAERIVALGPEGRGAP